MIWMTKEAIGASPESVIALEQSEQIKLSNVL